MTTCFGPHDLLEAQEDVTHPYCGYAITKGRIYVCTVIGAVEACVFHGRKCELVGVMVREAPLPMTWGWCSTHFKPITRGDGAALYDKLMSAPLSDDERDIPVPPREPTPAEIYIGEAA